VTVLTARAYDSAPADHSGCPVSLNAGDRVTVNDRGGVMAARTNFTTEEAREVGEQLGIDWASAPFDVEQFRKGMEVELEHGLHDSRTNVSGDDPVVTGKIALAHLNEFPDYYIRLERMEQEAKREQEG
jgi:Protein of unknown function (DUF5661)